MFHQRKISTAIFRGQIIQYRPRRRRGDGGAVYVVYIIGIVCSVQINDNTNGGRFGAVFGRM